MHIDKKKRFDTQSPPTRQKKFLQIVARIISKIEMHKHHSQVVYDGVEGLKPPYLLLCNHNAFFDFCVAVDTVAPARANYVVAIDGYIVKVGPLVLNLKPFMKPLGCICKRKFTNDLNLVRNLRQVIDNGDVAVMYPEARYSLCGTSAVLPPALGKICKMLNVPVVTLICHGHHINSPFWRLGDQKIRTEAEFSMLFTAEQVKEMSVEELNEALTERFAYDDYTWQLENHVEVKDPNRAKGLYKLLYQCPHCGTEFKMSSGGTRLRCNACGKEWEFTTLGQLKAVEGETEFAHVPDWYEWERGNVRKQVEEDTYSLVCPVHVSSLPHKKFIPIGRGFLRHDKEGFHVEVDGKYGHRSIDRAVPSNYSCHIEYEYLRKYGDALDISTNNDTWFVYGESDEFCLTKIALAVEELYKFYRPKREKKQGTE